MQGHTFSYNQYMPTSDHPADVYWFIEYFFVNYYVYNSASNMKQFVLRRRRFKLTHRYSILQREKLKPRYSTVYNR